MPPKKLGASKCLPSGVGQGFAVVVAGGSVVGASVGGSVGGSVVGGSVGGAVVGGSVGAGVVVVVVSGGGSVVGGSVGGSVVGISVVVGTSVVVMVPFAPAWAAAIRPKREQSKRIDFIVY